MTLRVAGRPPAGRDQGPRARGRHPHPRRARRRPLPVLPDRQAQDQEPVRGGGPAAAVRPRGGLRHPARGPPDHALPARAARRSRSATASSLWSPLENEERQILRLIEDARIDAELRRRLRERDQRDAVVEVIVQPGAVDRPSSPSCRWRRATSWATRGSRAGPRGSPLEYPVNLFGPAARFDLVDELERACRRQVFVDWEYFGSPDAPLREHRPRHRARRELPRPRRARLPGAASSRPRR